jgi:hypothetical protein
MDVAAASDGSFDQGDAGRFTGDVWLRSTLRAEDGGGAPEWSDPETDEEYGEGF